MSRRSLALALFAVFLAILVPVFFPGSLRGEDAPALKGIDTVVEGVMKEWKVPGLALAVIRDGKVILSRGHGYRDVEKKLPVTPRTLFAIGSISKSFTVSVLGMLIDDGKLEWDRPVRSYLPDFQLHDRVATELMTPRDLVTHRSGLPRHDSLWYGSPFSREELYERLRHLEPSKDFRSLYQYNNLMFLVAGYLAGKITGTTWEELVRTRIFEPLDMKRSNLSVKDSPKSDDFALPYMSIRGETRPVPFRNIDAIGPAGSINSCVEEMIRYVQWHIDRGRVGEKQLLSAANAEAMQTPQMVMPGGLRDAERGHSSYGLGFTISTYRGHKLVQHGGGIDGFISLLSFMPRKKIGLIVLTNYSGDNPVPTLVTYNVLDRLLGLEPVDWAGRFKKSRERNRARARIEEAGRGGRREGTTPSHSLAEYVGTYEHAGYGVARVRLREERLELSYNGLTFPLDHHHYDVFAVGRSARHRVAGARILFQYTKAGDIDRLLLPLEPAVKDIVFTRVADPDLKRRQFLERFTGKYVFNEAITAAVELRGEELVLQVPELPLQTLEPIRGNSFSVKGLEGYTVDFQVDGRGMVTGAVSYQPDGIFSAKKVGANRRGRF